MGGGGPKPPRAILPRLVLIPGLLKLRHIQGRHVLAQPFHARQRPDICRRVPADPAQDREGDPTPIRSGVDPAGGVGQEVDRGSVLWGPEGEGGGEAEDVEDDVDAVEDGQGGEDAVLGLVPLLELGPLLDVHQVGVQRPGLQRADPARPVRRDHLQDTVFFFEPFGRPGPRCFAISK